MKAMAFAEYYSCTEVVINSIQFLVGFPLNTVYVK